MKVSSILLQFALVAALATSAFATLDANNQPDFASASSSFSGSFDGSLEDHHHHGGDRLRDGSGSGFSDIGSHDGSHFRDYDDDGSHGSGYPCERLFGSNSGSHGGSGSGSSSRHRHKRYFRGDVGDDYNFGSGESNGSDGSFDESGSSSSGYVRCRHHHRHGSGSGSEGSHAFDDDVGDYDDEASSGSFDSPHGRHHHHNTHGSNFGSGSGDAQRFRGSRLN